MCSRNDQHQVRDSSEIGIMNSQSLTITLPETVYWRIKKQSQRMQRSVSEEVAAVITSNFPSQDRIAEDIEHELAALDLFSNDELWQAARMTASDSQTMRMQFLLDKQQREGLTESEQQDAERLSHYHNRIMLVRAKAAALLKQRGYDVTQLGMV